MLQGASIAAVFRVGGVGLAIALHLLLARVLTVGQYGWYAAIGAWITLGLLIATAGADTLIVRSAARSLADGTRDRLPALLRPHERRSVVLSVAIVAAAIVFTLGWPGLSSEARWMTATMFAALPFLAVGTLRQALLRAASRPAGALVPDYWVRPLAQIACVGALALGGYAIAGTYAAAAFLVASMAAWLVARVWTLDLLAGFVAGGGEDRAADTRWRDVLPFFVVTVATLVLRQTDLVLVGAMLDADAAGRYAVAMRVADLCSLVVVAGNVVLAPLISELHHAGRDAELRVAVGTAQRAMLTIGIAVGAVLAVFAPAVLSWFGPQYVASAATLRILLVAQIVAIALGPYGLLLSMTGREVSLARVLAASAIVNVGVCAALVAGWGATGAAVSTLFSTLAWRAMLAVLAIRTPPRAAAESLAPRADL